MSALLLALLLQATPTPGVEAAASPVPAATHDATGTSCCGPPAGPRTPSWAPSSAAWSAAWR